MHWAIRIIVAYCQEPRNYEPGLFLGMYPAYLSSTWAPWQPVLEVFMLKLVGGVVINVSGHIAGIISGFILTFLCLFIPKYCHLSFPWPEWAHSRIEQDQDQDQDRNQALA